MIISIDIDGVIVDREKYQIEKGIKYAKQHNLNSKIVNPQGYNVDEIFGWSKDDFKNFWREHIWDYSSIPPREEVKTVFTKLKNNGHKIIINTSRWLTKRQLPLPAKNDEYSN